MRADAIALATFRAIREIAIKMHVPKDRIPRDITDLSTRFADDCLALLLEENKANKERNRARTARGGR